MAKVKACSDACNHLKLDMAEATCILRITNIVKYDWSWDAKYIALVVAPAERLQKNGGESTARVWGQAPYTNRLTTLNVATNREHFSF